MLILHGDDDQIVPVADSVLVQARQRGDAESLPRAPPGMCSTTKDQVNADLLEFFQRTGFDSGVKEPGSVSVQPV